MTAVERRVSLLVYHHTGAEMVALRTGQPVVIGRAHPADVVAEDADLSRQHARFELLEGQVWVEDLESTNGTSIAGSRIQRAVVHPGEEVSIGSITISIHVLDSEGPRPPGVDRHDRFLEALEAEVTRGRVFRRSVALLMLRAQRPEAERATQWSRVIRRMLRPVDRICLYGPSSVLVALPEVDGPEAVRCAESLLAAGRTFEPSLVCGVALFPDAASSAEQLVGVASTAAQQATHGSPARLSPALGSGSFSAVVTPGPVVRSAAMLRVFDIVRRAAPSRIPVLVLGETGTGKEVVARALHDEGPHPAVPSATIANQLRALIPSTSAGWK